MTLGRPAAIPYNYVKVDMARGLESLTSVDHVHRDPNEQYSIGVFNATM